MSRFDYKYIERKTVSVISFQIEILISDKERRKQQKIGLLCFFIVILIVLGILVGFVIYLSTSR
jgi:hypothetical protein